MSLRVMFSFPFYLYINKHKHEKLKMNLLLEELKEMSLKCKVQGYERAVYLSQDNLPRVKEIGKELNKIGGINLMRRVGSELSFPLFCDDHTELNYVWNGIGEWLA